MRRHLSILLTLLLISLTLSACADKSSAPESIENYLKTKVKGDADKLASLSCKEYEAQALLDAASFESVNARIDKLTCKETGKQDKFTLISCEGTLVIQYRGEDPREQNLSGTTYLAIKEDDEWKMCGQQ
ncbi:MAG: hypothetical protein HY866_02575 [Chloroflexi bacterium]|nr:hypothetical protein [Chloroflexota bacterium]